MTVNLAGLSHLSYSSISRFLACPEQWRRAYLEGERGAPTAALIFGSAWHKTLETVLRVRAAGQVPDPLGVWLAMWSELSTDPEIIWGRHDPETLRLTGADMLCQPETDLVLTTIRPRIVDGAPDLERRIELRVPGVGVPIIGYVDCIGDDGIPWDFKTSERIWPASQAAKELQPAFYLAALNQAGERANPGGVFRHVIWTKTQPFRVQTFETRRSPSDLFAVMALARSVWLQIEAGQFELAVGSPVCRANRCPYWHDCVGAVSADGIPRILGLG